jgi:ATP-dependent Lhr-like helicase
VVLRAGVPLVWFDRRSHHLVTFPTAATDPTWAEALATLVKDGRARSVEVRKVNGARPVAGDPVLDALRAAGFVDGYRGPVLRG